jgi:hypothetical protein
MLGVRCDDNNLRLVGGHCRLIVMLARLSLIAAALLPTCAAQQTADSPSWVQFIGMELRQLRVELLEQRMAEEGDRLLQMQRDVGALRLEQNKRQNEEQLQKQQLAELDKHASDPSASSQARAQIEAAKGEIASSADLTRVAYSSFIAREAELNERMQTARARLQSITDRLKQLSTRERK